MTALYVGDVRTGRARFIRDINRTPDCLKNLQGLGIQYDFISNVMVRGENAFFAASDKTTIFSCPNRVGNSELWLTDGTPEGTRKVREIYPGIGGSVGKELGYIGSNPRLLTFGGD